jgi:hypothetical protein
MSTAAPNVSQPGASRVRSVGSRNRQKGCPHTPWHDPRHPARGQCSDLIESYEPVDPSARFAASSWVPWRVALVTGPTGQSALATLMSVRRAEAEGFEPPDPRGSPAFKAGAFGRSATLPAVSVAGRLRVQRCWPVWPAPGGRGGRRSARVRRADGSARRCGGFRSRVGSARRRRRDRRSGTPRA